VDVDIDKSGAERQAVGVENPGVVCREVAAHGGDAVTFTEDVCANRATGESEYAILDE
jgi:hypothetical protein